MIKNAILQILCDWAVRCFGQAHVTDQRVRALRLAEEAVELAQACDVEAAKVHELVDMVYAREKGNPVQEMGGVLMTASLMCWTVLHLHPDAVLVLELRRVLAKSPEHFAKRNQEKLDAGMVGESGQ